VPTHSVVLPVQQLRQPRDVDRDPPPLVGRQNLRLPRLGLILPALDAGERLPVGVAYYVAARNLVDAPGWRESARWFCHGRCLSVDAAEHPGQGLTSVDKRVGFAFEDPTNFIPGGFPLWPFASQVECGQHPFEPVNQSG
jgi:hypothetical protein